MVMMVLMPDITMFDVRPLLPFSIDIWFRCVDCLEEY